MPNEENPTTYDQALDDQEQVNVEEVGEANEESDEVQDKPEEGQAKPQSRAENAKFAQQRREAEKAAKEKTDKETDRLRQEAYNQGRIDGIGKTNPWTGEPIEDEEDLKLYDIMAKLDKEGKDPVKEAYKVLREEKAQRKQQAKAELEQAEKRKDEEEKRVASAVANIKALGEKYPECNAAWFKENYEKQGKFRSLVDHGYTPIEAYEFINGEKATAKEATPAPTTPSTVPSGSGGKKSVATMTLEEYEKYALDELGGL